MLGRAVEAVLDEELVEGVGVNSGVDSKHLGRCGRWGDTEARSPVGVEPSDRRCHCGGLACAGGPDHEDEASLSCDSPRRVVLHSGQLTIGIEVLDVVPAFGGPAAGEVEDVLLLVEDRPGGEDPVEGSFGDRSPVVSERDVVGHGS